MKDQICLGLIHASHSFRPLRPYVNLLTKLETKLLLKRDKRPALMWRYPKLRNFIEVATLTLISRGNNEHVHKKTAPFYVNKNPVVCICEFAIKPRI